MQPAFDIEVLINEAVVSVAPAWTGAPLHVIAAHYPRRQASASPSSGPPHLAHEDPDEPEPSGHDDENRVKCEVNDSVVAGHDLHPTFDAALEADVSGTEVSKVTVTVS